MTVVLVIVEQTYNKKKPKTKMLPFIDAINAQLKSETHHFKSEFYIFCSIAMQRMVLLQYSAK
jgi:hypothetical protein